VRVRKCSEYKYTALLLVVFVCFQNGGRRCKLHAAACMAPSPTQAPALHVHALASDDVQTWRGGGGKLKRQRPRFCQRVCACVRAPAGCAMPMQGGEVACFSERRRKNTATMAAMAVGIGVGILGVGLRACACRTHSGPVLREIWRAHLVRSRRWCHPRPPPDGQDDDFNLLPSPFVCLRTVLRHHLFVPMFMPLALTPARLTPSGLAFDWTATF
jgi:hypothetical protein